MAFIDRIRELNNGGGIDRSVSYRRPAMGRARYGGGLARARCVHVQNSTIALAEPLLVETLAKRGERVETVVADLHDAGYIVVAR